MAKATPEEIERIRLAIAINGDGTEAKNARLSSVTYNSDGTISMYIHTAGMMIYATVDADEVDNLIEEQK